MRLKKIFHVVFFLAVCCCCCCYSYSWIVVGHTLGSPRSAAGEEIRCKNRENSI